MSAPELARKRIFARDSRGARQELTLWISAPYQRDVDGLTQWHCDWGILGILDKARGFVGPTAFDALVANIEAMKDHLKATTKGRTLIDADIEALNQQHQGLGVNEVVSIAKLFGK